MSHQSIILSSSGLKNIIQQDDREFTFIFKEQEIKLKNIYSEFISPIVSHMHHADPTIDRLYIDYQIKSTATTNDHGNDISGIQTLIVNISSGQSIEMNKEQLQDMRNISIFLGNEELFNKINEIFPLDTNDDNIGELLEIVEHQEKTKNGTNIYNQITIEIESIYDILSANFHKLDKKKLNSLSKRILIKIISSDHLQIENSDSLFDIIEELFDNEEGEEEKFESPTKIDFYEKVDLKSLSEEKFAKFLRNINPSEISGNLWKNMLDRLIGVGLESRESESAKQDQNRKPPMGEFLFDDKEENRMNGIIRHLTNESGGNVHDKGIVCVTCSSERGESCRLSKNAVDLDNKQTRFVSKNRENSWLKYDFKEKKVHPTHYSIRSKLCVKGDWHPQHWVIEGSNSGEEDWKILDTRNNITVLNDKSVTHTFDIQEKLLENEFYRFLRIRQTGKNAGNNYYLGFSALEYFGYITL